MTTSNDFKADKRELEFVLFEFLKIQDLAQYNYFSDHTKDSLSDMLNSALDFTDKVVGPLNKPYDRIGCKHNPETKTVSTPQGTKEAYKSLVENGFMNVSESYDSNGAQAPNVLSATFQEIFSGANQAFTMFSGLTKSGSHVLQNFGSDWMKRLVKEKIYQGDWTATMCLTEPNAGSAVGDIKASASRVSNGNFLLKGIKQWISGGENDFTENIIHLVLARIEGAPEGIEGVSLFLVPKNKFDTKTLKISEPNDLFCISIEEKMGIHGNPSCLMSFGDNNRCEAFLVGEENKGIHAMFLMMNEARIGVGLQGIAQASVAFLNAESYAKERIQGVDLTVKRTPNQSRIAIVDHPDVKRMLLRQRAIVEGGRTLCFLTTHLHDLAHNVENETERNKYAGFVELLTPITKAWGTDMGYDAILNAVQTYGGYGYVKDYPVEQCLRDAKITSIYEGTNGIQALDFVGRKLRLQNGDVFMGWLERHTDFIEAHREHNQIGSECNVLEEYIGTLLEAVMMISERGQAKDRKGAIMNAYPLMMAFGHIVVGGLLLEQAKIASDKLDTLTNFESEKRFYSNKIKTAAFFVYQILPEAKAYLAQVMSTDRSFLDFDFVGNSEMGSVHSQNTQAGQVFAL